MKRYWERISTTVDGMSLRERAMIFVAAAFVAVSLLNALLLDPLLAKQKTLSAQIGQQQEKLKELQAQMDSLVQAKRDDEHSPLRQRAAQLRQQLQEQESYLQSRRDRLIEPEKMADLLRKMLDKEGRLQLVELKTLPVSLLVEKPQATAANQQPGRPREDVQKKIYKHGVQIAVRGGYLDLMRYVAALEGVPAQMFWGEASMSVEKYPDAVITLTLYTLSLDRVWLTI